MLEIDQSQFLDSATTSVVVGAGIFARVLGMGVASVTQLKSGNHETAMGLCW